MTRLFSSPHFIDLIMAFTVLEAAALIVWQRLAARRSDSIEVSRCGRTIDIVLMVLPGLCLMMALRAALDGAVWPWVPATLAAAFIAHLADVHRRWRR